jgi:two-component system, OmpR family, phosphate regulon response regulator PhoB
MVVDWRERTMTAVLLRASAPDSGGQFGVRRHGPLEADLDRLHVRVDGRVVALEGLQLSLLVHFVRHPEKVMSRADLLREVWGPRSCARDEKSVDVLVCRLRRRLGPAGRLIQSVRSFGYRFDGTSDEAD